MVYLYAISFIKAATTTSQSEESIINGIRTISYHYKQT